MASLLPEGWTAPLENLQERVSRFMQQWLPGGASQRGPERMSDSLPDFMQQGGPRVDLAETADGLMVTAEVPGLDKQDCQIEITGRRLVIRADKKVCRDYSRDGVHQSECRYGSFTRNIELPYQVDEKNIKAYLQNGILTIRLARLGPRSETRYRVPIT